MPDEPNATPQTPLPAAVETMGNAPEARNPDGSIKDPALAATTNPSPTESKPVEAKPAEAKPAEAGVVPEKYEFKAPDGYEIDPKFAEEATGIFKELGLTQDAATKLFDMYTAKVLEASNAPMKAVEDMRNDWRSKASADKEIGNGQGDLKPEVKAAISTAIDAAMPAELAKEFRQVMTETGMGDNPVVIKAIFKMAEAFAEGKPVAAGGPSAVTKPGSPRSAASAMYPNLPSSSAS